MRRKLAFSLSLAFALLPVAGCWDSTSPEHIAWVAAVGVDKGSEGNFLFTFQTVLPKAAASGASGGGGGGSGGGGGGGQGHSFVVYSVEAPDVITAIEMSDAFVARRVNLLHSKALILGEEVVEEGVGRLIAPAIRYREFRRTLYVMVSRGTAQEFIRQAQPRLETDPGLWYEVMMTWQKEMNLVPPVRIHEFALAMERPGLGARAGVVAARHDIAAGGAETREPGDPGGRFGSPAAVLAGDVDRQGEIPVEFIGTAVFKADKLKGYLTGQETRAVALLRGELDRRTPVSVPDPKHPDQRVVLLVQNQAQPQITVRRNGEQVHVSFVIRVEGDIGSVPSVTDYTEPESMALLEKAVERYMSRIVQDVLETSLGEWGTDLYGIGDRLKPTFPTIQDWIAWDWGTKVDQVTFDSHLVFHVRRHGLQAEPAKPQG